MYFLTSRSTKLLKKLEFVVFMLHLARALYCSAMSRADKLAYTGVRLNSNFSKVYIARITITKKLSAGAFNLIAWLVNVLAG